MESANQSNTNGAPTTMLIGIGSHHGDDRLGWELIDLLRQAVPPSEHVRFKTCDRSALDWLDGQWLAERIIFIDAVRSEKIPGSLHHYIVDHETEETRLNALSCHGLSLLQAIKLGQTLNCLPAQVSIYGVELGQTLPFKGISQAVQRGMLKLRDEILCQINT